MGVLDAAMQAEAMGRQESAGLVDAITGGLGMVTENRKADKFKQAGKRLFELGGLSQDNLSQVITEYDLSPEETKEFITTWGGFYDTMKKIRGESTAYYDDKGNRIDIGEGEQPPPGHKTKEGWEVSDKNKPKDYGSEFVYQGDTVVSISKAPGAEYSGVELPSTRNKRLEAELRNKNGSGKGFAPEHILMRNLKTGEPKEVNVRNSEEYQKALDEGFVPIGPEAKGYLGKSGELGAVSESDLIKGSTMATQSISTLNTMKDLLDRVETGKLADWKKTVQQYSEYLGLPGVDVQNLSAAEAFNALSNQLALQSRNQGEGMVLTGQTSDRDLTFLENMNPQLITSKGGNKLLIDIRTKLLKRQVKIATLAEEYKAKHGGIFDAGGFNKYISGKMSNSSVFGIPEEATPTGRDDPVTGLPIYEMNGKFFIPEF